MGIFQRKMGLSFSLWSAQCPRGGSLTNTVSQIIIIRGIQEGKAPHVNRTRGRRGAPWVVAVRKGTRHRPKLPSGRYCCSTVQLVWKYGTCPQEQGSGEGTWMVSASLHPRQWFSRSLDMSYISYLLQSFKVSLFHRTSGQFSIHLLCTRPFSG